MFSDVTDEILKYLGIIALLFGVFWSLHKVYILFIKPKTRKSKYCRLYSLIEDWFDEIDKNLESDLNYSLLNNKENKIHQFIIDNNLDKDKLRFSKKFRRKFLRFCGIGKEYINDKELFYKYGRVHSNWIYLDVYINLLIGAFYTFSAHYQAKTKETNFADVDMRVKLLKVYWDYKRK